MNKRTVIGYESKRKRKLQNKMDIKISKDVSGRNATGVFCVAARNTD